MTDSRPAAGGQHAEPSGSEAAATSDPGPRSLPRTQPARALLCTALYFGAVALVGVVLQLLTSGYALLLFCVLVAVGLLVPFIVLGQRPDAPERAARPSFPVLGQPGALPFGQHATASAVSKAASLHASGAGQPATGTGQRPVRSHQEKEAAADTPRTGEVPPA